MVQIKAPSTYHNEYGLLARSGEHIAGIGRHLFIISGRRAFEAIQDQFIPALDAHHIRHHIEFYSGKTTAEDIAGFAKAASGFDALVAIGGGKVIDLGKAAAEDAKIPVIAIPTVASNCSAYTSLTVVYNKEGGYAAYRRLARAPELILADTGVLRRAPKRYIAAGMGDTLAKWLEAFNFFGPSYASVNEILGVTIARMAYDLVLAHYQEVYALAETSAETEGRDVFVDMVDAILLLAGLIGSIRGGKHVAAYVHPLHDALTQLPETRGLIHGELVAFANAVQLALFRQDETRVREMLDFNRRLKLPVTLDDLGLEGTEKNVRRLSGAFDWNETAQDVTTPFAIGPGELEAALLKTHTLGISVKEGRKEPDNRGFDGFFNEKSHQNLQVQQAPRPPSLCSASCLP
jgi:glycerol dehydrogenase